jgi:hypothetical protein
MIPPRVPLVRCVPLGGEGTPLLPGWNCCACSRVHPEAMGTYNGDQRPSCKACGHVRCDLPAARRS